MAENDVRQWYAELPPVTRFLLSGVFGVSLICNLGLIPLRSILLDWDPIWNNFEIWRCFTCIFYSGRFSFPFLSNLFFLYRYSLLLEKEVFNSKTADYCFMIMICSAALVIVGLNPWVPLPYFGISLTMCLVYVWSQLNKDVIVSFFFGLKFQAMYLPWVMMGFYLLIGGHVYFEVAGIIAGHLYYFFQYVYPVQTGVHFLATPQFLKNYFPETRQTTSQNFGTSFTAPNREAEASASAAAAPNPWQGRGHTLGSS